MLLMMIPRIFAMVMRVGPAVIVVKVARMMVAVEHRQEDGLHTVGLT